MHAAVLIQYRRVTGWHINRHTDTWLRSKDKVWYLQWTCLTCWLQSGPANCGKLNSHFYLFTLQAPRHDKYQQKRQSRKHCLNFCIQERCTQPLWLKTMCFNWRTAYQCCHSTFLEFPRLCSKNSQVDVKIPKLIKMKNNVTTSLEQ